MRDAAFADIDAKLKKESALAKVRMLESVKKQLNKYVMGEDLLWNVSDISFSSLRDSHRFRKTPIDPMSTIRSSTMESWRQWNCGWNLFMTLHCPVWILFRISLTSWTLWVLFLLQPIFFSTALGTAEPDLQTILILITTFYSCQFKRIILSTVELDVWCTFTQRLMIPELPQASSVRPMPSLVRPGATHVTWWIQETSAWDLYDINDPHNR